jgi:hypothetical protein
VLPRQSGEYLLDGIEWKNENGKIIESAVEARGGFLGRQVLVVLVVSALLVISIFGGLYVHYFG